MNSVMNSVEFRSCFVNSSEDFTGEDSAADNQNIINCCEL